LAPHPGPKSSLTITFPIEADRMFLALVIKKWAGSAQNLIGKHVPRIPTTFLHEVASLIGGFRTDKPGVIGVEPLPLSGIGPLDTGSRARRGSGIIGRGLRNGPVFTLRAFVSAIGQPGYLSGRPQRLQ
jgi:hypothetical protein